MGKHIRTARHRARLALASVLVGLCSVGTVGIAQAQGPAPVEGTPCTEVARACVDLDAGQAWLIEDGKVVRGPVAISSGGPGKETPRGDFRVEWKNANHRSTEFDGARMPFAVFFAEGGIAFHEGNVNTSSAGCVRLAHEDATVFYDFLQVDNPVQVR
jgi:hypothetical protein